MKDLNLAVIGCGRMGKMHIENILRGFPEVQISAVVDNTPDTHWLSRYGLADRLQTLEEVLSNKKISVLVIAASSSEHVHLIQQGASYGKHMFCEKPIAFSLQGIQQAIDACYQHKVKLQVGFNRRFDPSFLRLQQRTQAGEAGKICLIKITNRDPLRPDLNFIPRSGGLFLDFNVHDFDMIRFVSQEEVEYVQAFGSNLIDPEIGRLGDIDTCTINCKLSSGALATIDASREALYGYDQRIEVLGTNGAIQADNIHRTSVVRLAEEGISMDPLKHTFVERYAQAYQDQMKAFFEYVHTQEAKSPVDAQDTLKAVALAIAADTSHRENRVVHMQEIL